MRTTVRFRCTPERAFGYLADPRNRPQWQSSLRRVVLEEPEEPEPRLGQRWTDVTKVGIRPRLTTTRYEPPLAWAERGTWRGVSADLELTFAAVGEGCEVGVHVEVRGRGVMALPARVAALVAPRAITADLRTAAELAG